MTEEEEEGFGYLVLINIDLYDDIFPFSFEY